MGVSRGLLILFLLVDFAVAANSPAKHSVRPNIILITLDTTRADRMGFLGSERGLTPNLDALAKQGVVFIHAYSQVPLTTPSHAAILTGTYPQFNQVRELDAPLSAKVPYLPDLLGKNGYRTGAILGSIIFTPKINAEGFDRGFSTYDANFHPQAVGEDRYQSAERRADVVVDRAVHWLSKKRDGPFFLWLHFYDPHSPYDPPEPYKTRYSVSPYDGEIAYMDSALGRLISSLREKNLYTGSVIAVMADHGEAFGEHGEQYHGVFVYDETIRVPLVLKLPGGRFAGDRVESRVALVDVAPTLLQEAGAAVPTTMQGKSLLALITAAGTSGTGEKIWGDRRIYSESEYGKVAFNWSPLYGWRTGKYLYVAAPNRELYDQGLDPAAEHNLATASQAIADTLLSQLADFQKKTSSAPNAKAEISTTGSKSLSALGYLPSLGIVSKGVEDVGGVDPKSKVDSANLLHNGLLDSQDVNPEKAIGELEQVLQEEPNARMAYLALGRCYLRLKQFDKAVPVLRKASETMPGLGEAQYELGRALVESGKWDEAAPAFEAALVNHPMESEWHFNLAVVYERTRRLPEAISEFRTTLKLNPDHFRANLLLGRLLGMKGSSAEALPFLQKAEKLNPDSPDVHMYLANVYTLLKQTSQAEKERDFVERLKSKPPE
jgi:arylsulfatase A-like enzyme/Flp pilus assembly protein TadD